jgi:stearoyl-CoA desaturase (delta-9 desaturase)
MRRSVAGSEQGALPMTAPQRVANLLGVAVPAAGLVVAIVLLWDRLVGPLELGVAFGLYVITGLGISVGFHRLFAHRSFETGRSLRVLLAVLGSMAVEGPVVKWVANHRMHHTYADEHGDPHSPHVGAGGGVVGSLRGLWHAHAGWTMTASHRAAPERYARDLLADPALRFVDRTFAVWAVAGLALAFGIGYAVFGTLRGALLTLLWGGLVRIFALHHVTFSINSLCHFMGGRRFQTGDESRNLAWLAPFSLGEAWHNNHHAFPTSARHGLGRFQFDPSAWLINVLERCGLAWDVVRISPERQRMKLSTPAQAHGQG